MFIQNIRIEGFRNLNVNNKLELHPNLNIFIGSNGSGKSSFLESIYFLALGRSFRTNKANNIISFNHDFAAVYATYGDQIASEKIKISCIKYYNKNKLNKIGGAMATNLEVANLTPTQFINDETSKLIFKEPELRRKFLDWLSFYADKGYQLVWKKFQIILHQRNKFLKKICLTKAYQNSEMIKILDNIDLLFVELAQQIALFRQAIWDKFKKVWLQVIKDFNINEPLITELKLFNGWSGDLRQQLLNHRELDLQKGFTHYGPHKADIQFKINGKLAKDVLSKGQGKLAAVALILARTKFIKDFLSSSRFISVLLIDDLSSELDDDNIDKILTAISFYKDNLQIFITSTEHRRIYNILSPKEAKWFKVSKGNIFPYDQ